MCVCARVCLASIFALILLLLFLVVAGHIFFPGSVFRGIEKRVTSMNEVKPNPMGAVPMVQVQVPADAFVGQLLSTQLQNGQLVQFTVQDGMVPGTTVQVPYQAPVPVVVPTVIAQPLNFGVPPPALQMARNDAFQGAEAVIIKQEFALMEAIGCEAKNRYRVHRSFADPKARSSNGQQVLYVREDSQCLERLCCGPNRTLTLLAHTGFDRNSPVWLQMHKPFHLQGCCFMRPKLLISDGMGTALGHIQDPFTVEKMCLCQMDSHVYNSMDQKVFEIGGTFCQPAICFPCCGDVLFEVKDPKTRSTVGEIRKMFDGCGEICLHTNKFKLLFPQNITPENRSLLFGAAMLIDLEYFEVQKNNQ